MREPAVLAQSAQPLITTNVLRNRTHRRRYALRPWLTLLGLVPALLLHHIPTLATTGYWVFIPGLLIGVRKTWKARGHRLYALTCSASATMWVYLAFTFGLQGAGRWLPLLLVFPGIFPLSWWFWQRHRVRPVKREEPVEEEPEVLPPLDPIIMYFNMYFAAQGCLGWGMRIDFLEEAEAGRRYRITVVPGKHTADSVVRLIPNIASAFGPLNIGTDRLVVDTEWGPSHMVMMTVLRPKPPVREIQEFTGPTLVRHTGYIVDGPYSDGQGTAMLKLYKVDEHGRPMRATSGMFVGQQGSGKSGIIKHKVLEHMSSGLFAVVLLDGSGGGSMPELYDDLYWAATNPDEWIKAVKALVRLRLYRAQKLLQRGVDCWYATPQDPFVQLVIDEAHKVLAVRECGRGAMMLLQEAEKFGIGVDIVTPIPLTSQLGDASGGNVGLIVRELAQNGNCVVCRTGSNWTKSVTMGDWTVDPKALPDLPGAHYVRNGESTRQVWARGIRVADARGWMKTVPDIKCPDDEEQMMDGGTGDFFQRRERFEESRTGTISAESMEAQVALALGMARPVDTPAAASSPAASGGDSCMRICLDIVRKHGRIIRKDLLAEIGDRFSESAVAQALRGMENAGLVTSKLGGHGVWMSKEYAAKHYPDS